MNVFPISRLKIAERWINAWDASALQYLLQKIYVTILEKFQMNEELRDRLAGKGAIKIMLGEEEFSTEKPHVRIMNFNPFLNLFHILL